ncbi:efflux RND transporter periplasmic adaptor subunit [Vibrio vulnificus]|uniref:Probable Co/Zn/Cd efflux system membrane fusion protein n=1 Tax=Vibrio vulnificus (strain CMCP6) TaxID=216895 RepID=A0A3Q0KZ13_VIBVU|nr:efflux RND transporter periplasmic adaptor subunit [Vibrio vulnificus]AAO07774.1 Probable Co/Zn/Cd efflux system membrane fusion protein [Vibrio vulnificus CMCP6]QBH29728.1 putative Co/Zn/Cd efflux system membrane fusion protein [Vibrio vulnificus]QBN15854.1 efflux RND transporter periplasmic adaptor subunit [Vibrio vulnificus]HAS6056458.1 efflux RND transporter periplasmic adaptor subunit [Vibrio vulnificus]HAS6110013.1 efflux RND transporter periplasmic adaptor subunit [Vibrio vulnificus]
MKSLQIATVALLIGAALGFTANQYFNGHDMSAMAATDIKASHEPLYWVAPMDPNYKRDKPGKSPMGMDLIPVYADDLAGANDKPGTVKIDPSVENNLGVKTAAVELAKLSPRIETVGYIAFDESQLWQTNVRVSGWVEKLYINAVGEQVKKGEVLFTLYSPELVKAQEELLNAKRTGRDGLVKGATERLLSLGVDREQINQVIRRGKASQTIEIKALANGVIASLNIREGGYLSPAQAVISAGPLNEVWVDAEVFERQAHWLTNGSQASMTLDALPGKAWQGEVDYVYPILDPKTRTLRMRLKFANPNGELKPNMFANITLQPVSDSEVLTVPKSSVIRSGGMTRVVLAEGEGKYRSARIETGREADDKVEVLQGLNQGDRIVTSAHFMLDSESSQSADLSRINGVEAAAETAWAKGEITDLMADHGMLTINHQPVPEWNWPGMTMNFNAAQGVDLSALQKGQAIEFEMQKTDDGQYQIIAIKADNSVIASEVWLSGDISMLMADFGMVTLSHLPVTEWNWQAGEINFSVGDEINLSGFEEGQKVRFLVAKEGSDYQLKQLEAMGGQ